MYKIDKNIPITPARDAFSKTAKNSELLETLCKLKIGHSFLIPYNTTTKSDQIASLRSRLAHFKNRVRQLTNNSSFEITTRQEKKGLRVWRKR